MADQRRGAHVALLDRARRRLHRSPPKTSRACCACPKMQGALLVATEVGDYAAFERCKALGFTYFQGEYFAQPRTFKHRGVATSGLGALRRLAELTTGDVSFEDLERIIASDVGLSLKLLRYVNSAFFSLPRTVSSVHEALNLLGVRTVRRWATVMVLSSIPDTPDELVALGLRRAHMCEILAGSASAEERETMFTIGLFSVADALLDMPMADVLETLPFTEEIQAALLRHEGPKGELLAAVAAYERGEFPTLPRPTPPLPGRRVPRRAGVGRRSRRASRSGLRRCAGPPPRRARPRRGCALRDASRLRRPAPSLRPRAELAATPGADRSSPRERVRCPARRAAGLPEPLDCARGRPRVDREPRSPRSERPRVAERRHARSRPRRPARGRRRRASRPSCGRRRRGSPAAAARRAPARDPARRRRSRRPAPTWRAARSRAHEAVGERPRRAGEPARRVEHPRGVEPTRAAPRALRRDGHEHRGGPRSAAGRFAAMCAAIRSATGNAARNFSAPTSRRATPS